MTALEAVAAYQAAVRATCAASDRWQAVLVERNHAENALAEAKIAEREAAEKLREALALDGVAL